MLGFNHAFRGLLQMFRSERNFKIHILIFAFVAALGIYFNISFSDWTSILLVSGLVLSLEVINSAIEKVCDLYSTEKSEKIKNIKDISAGAVLIAALFAVVIGMMVFFPYFE
ncbi:diacylglycerol kinase family protein [Brumimicrobium oceani]|uniref:Diacylglycerol kinase n=1 Tax=Brumimicrobium oceani TaxID=2100725 RepID=A0A2U2XDH6_9FLAO|nr:diacylglycerol kinase family protein [Brumimicrobium oceani]PWH85855.1 diacylglycerol kinase [Brumimicrobium oceani]